MKIIWKIIKSGFFLSALLLLGQIPIGDRTVGGHLVNGIYLSIVWVGDSLRDAEWFHKMSNDTREKKLKSSRVAVAPKEVAPPQEDKVQKEKITTEDRDSLIKLLDD